MLWMIVPGLLLLLVQVMLSKGLEPSSHTMFPKGFKFGVATASYQVEGAWNEDGKGPNLWDTFTHDNPKMIRDHTTGDIACDSYHQYKLDVENIKRIGFKMYRFSIAWSRVLPNGTTDYVNPKGVQYYHNLIDELLANGIEPMVTIFHWDMPKVFQDKGGWLNVATIDHFVNYADFLFKTYGSKVKWWVTINEATSITTGYGGVEKAPALNYHGYGEYIAGHNMLLAHAKAYRVYQKKYKDFGGQLSMSFLGYNCYPKNESDLGDIAGVERCFQFQYGWFIQPLYSGDYPKVMRKMIDEKSKNDGLISSRLPTFTDEEKKELKGSYDYIGFNHYTSRIVTSGAEGPDPSMLRDANLIQTIDPNWPQSGVDWIQIVPQGIRAGLVKIKKEFGNPMVIITENGVGTTSGVDDKMRIDYYESYMAEIRNAIYKDGCNITGHISWTLMDNFEWLYGYEAKFGLMELDVNSPERTRTMRKSAYWFQHYIKMHDLLEN